MISDPELASRWRSARPPMAGVHLDSAACSRQSSAAIEAAARHARHEAEIGGYQAAEAAGLVLHAARQVLAGLTGMTAEDVVFTTGSGRALELLLGSWPDSERTVACLPGEFGPNLAVLADQGFTVELLPVDQAGRARPDEVAEWLRAHRPSLVHVDGVASHRGIAQPIAELAAVCTDLAVPLVIDAAQAMVQLDCAVGAAAVYSSSRKWLAGPRGVGFLAVSADLGQRLVRPVPRLAAGEANVAAQVGFAVALGEIRAAGVQRVRARLAAVGRHTREHLDGVAGWRVVEPVDEPTAITTVVPPEGVDPAAVRAGLIAEHRILTTVAEPARAPGELTGPVLRISPHVDMRADDVRLLADALRR